MGKAISGGEMGSKLPKGGAVMNPESRAALEKLLWKWMPGGNKGKVGGIKKFMATGDFAKKLKMDSYSSFAVADLSDEQVAAMMQYLKPKVESRLVEGKTDSCCDACAQNEPCCGTVKESVKDRMARLLGEVDLWNPSAKKDTSPAHTGSASQKSSAAKPLEKCPPGHVRNKETNRCISLRGAAMR